MKLVLHDTAESFIEASLSLLLKNEVLNNLPIGISMGIRDGRSYGDGDPFFATVEVDGRTVAAFLQTPPRYLHVYSLAEYEKRAFGLLIDELRRSGVSIPGVIGEEAMGRGFAELWKERFGGDWKVKRGLRLFQLDAVTPPESVAGELRIAGERDEDLLTGWVGAFCEEVGEPQGEEESRKSARFMIERKSVYFWVDGAGVPVSCVCNARKIVTGEVVNMVFTPLKNRGRGYASVAVAELSQRLLDSGAAFCCLFTDVENPTSNKIYQKVGYRVIAKYATMDFV